MDFNLQKSLQILERTPAVLQHLLSGIDESWIYGNSGPETWSPFDVVGHLLHGEKTDWIARMNIVLEQGSNRHFAVFDRFAQFEESKGKTIQNLLDEFASVRSENLVILKKRNPDDEKLLLRGIHPKFGEVTLSQLLSTWTVHDLVHISQISVTMARQYKKAIGPWIEYINTLKD